MKKNLELLRPFDLEKAKAGEAICCRNGNKARIIVYVPEIKECVVVVHGGYESVAGHFSNGRYWEDGTCDIDLFMEPLAWVEGKPVYKGDRLWYQSDYSCFSISVTGLNMRDDGRGLEGTVLERTHGRYGEPGELTWATFDCWSWDKPKTKREAWVNVYSEAPDDLWSNIHPTKAIADHNAGPTRKACVRIEWEE